MKNLSAAFMALVLTASFIPQASVTAEVLPEEGLVGYWSFDGEDASQSEVNADKWNAYIGEEVNISQTAMIGKGIQLQKNSFYHLLPI